ncbi:hypothetical protein MVEG_01266 [Podila verticillata NRRL 6337]|nr:hypothetical protein MVEG_01266 [Podila verticillata NRRL 6337]
MPYARPVVNAKDNAKMHSKRAPDAHSATSIIQVEDSVSTKAAKMLEDQLPDLPRPVTYSGAELYSGHWCRERTGQELLDHLAKMPKFVDMGVPTRVMIRDISHMDKIVEGDDIKLFQKIPSPAVIQKILEQCRPTESPARFGKENRVFTYSALVRMSNLG